MQPTDRLIEVSGHQAHLVPGLRGIRRVEPLDHREDVTQGEIVAHVGPAGIEPTTSTV